MFAEKRLFDEQWAVRFESFRQLLRHGPVQPAMEINTSVNPQSLHSLQSLDTGLQQPRRIEPPNIIRGIHLDSFEALRYAFFGGALDITRSVAADPGIDAHSIADFASQQLPDRHVEFARFEIPECNVYSCESGHEDWPAAVEGFAPCVLPEGFDVVGFVADEAGDVAVKGAFDCFRVAL